jgi:hypothetical protein
MDHVRLFYGSLSVFGFFQGLHASVTLASAGLALVPVVTLLAAGFVLAAGVAGLRRGDAELPVGRPVVYVAVAGAVVSAVGVVYDLAGGA